jgi:uncharacterized protein (DUF2267 family)
MRYDEFVGAVQQRARLATREAAEAATRATLETLGERLTAGAAGDLAAQLPPEAAEPLRRRPGGLETRDLDDWIDAVARRERCERAEAAFHARAVLDVVRDAVSAGQADKIEDQLPPPLRSLWRAGPDGEWDAPEG